MNIYIIIPSKNCSLKFYQIIYNLCKNIYFYRLIIVDDGSNLKSKKILSEIKKIDDRIILITNKKNLGQGGSIKKAINSISKLEIAKIITMDDDGQHHLDDVKKIANKFKNNTSANFVCYGVRRFTLNNTPLKSFVGNYISQLIFYCITKKKLSDTQTGLRIYSNFIAQRFNKIKNNGFDFHNIMNFYLVKINIKIKETSIKTIYFKKNKLTKFKSINDSSLIIKSVISFLKNKY